MSSDQHLTCLREVDSARNEARSGLVADGSVGVIAIALQLERGGAASC